MAEVVDFMATVLSNASSSVGESVWCQSGRVQKWLVFLCLAVGKAADIAADWVMVGQLLSGAFSQRTDSKECLIAAAGSAILGTAIELFAAYHKVTLYREVEEGPLRLLENLRLNRRLAWPRFLCDDLPATILGIYLIATGAQMAGGDSALASQANGSSILNVTDCMVKTRTMFTASAAGPVESVTHTSRCSVLPIGDEGDGGAISVEIVLIALSCGYSLMAMLYHLLKKAGSVADELKAQDVKLSDLRAKGYQAREMHGVGYTRSDMTEAGYTVAEMEAGMGVGPFRLQRTLTGHGDDVISVCALDGERLASGSFDKTVRVWDLTTGEAVRTLTGHGDYVTSVCALDGERLASGSADKTVRVWDATGLTIGKPAGHSLPAQGPSPAGPPMPGTLVRPPAMRASSKLDA